MSAAKNLVPMTDEAEPQDEQRTRAEIESVHEYHAEATVLKASLKHPLEEKIHPRAHVKLPKDGRYDFKHAEPFRFEGVISYRNGYTQVAGHPSSKKDGFATLVTSVLEGVNVLDVVTVDRVVAQISTVHPKFETGNQVPSVTFLGTRFENLRIGGHEIKIEPALHILGTPKDDTSYFADGNVTDAVNKQNAKIAALKPLTTEASEEDDDAVKDDAQVMTCSLVESINGIPRAFGSPFGHVIDLPHFGRIFLGELIIRRYAGNNEKDLRERKNDKYRFNLTMIRLHMGCVGTGTASLAVADSNGTGTGGHH